MHKRKDFDIQSYIERSQNSPCFICEMLSGTPGYEHHIIYRDESAVVFLNKYPALYGYVLVAPCQHKEHVTSDFSIAEYLSLQELIHRVSEAVKKTVPTERMYILSLGSRQGNRHVHWHIAPLPPGVPYEKQQFEALNIEGGILDLSEEEKSQLTRRISEAMKA